MGSSPNLLLTRAKLKILVQMSISLFLKSYGRPYGEFSEPGFPHNFAKNNRQDLKLGCIDASRRQHHWNKTCKYPIYDTNLVYSQSTPSRFGWSTLHVPRFDSIFAGPCPNQLFVFWICKWDPHWRYVNSDNYSLVIGRSFRSSHLEAHARKSEHSTAVEMWAN
jgi:hypothetical protein